MGTTKKDAGKSGMKPCSRLGEGCKPEVVMVYVAADGKFQGEVGDESDKVGYVTLFAADAALRPPVPFKKK